MKKIYAISLLFLNIQSVWAISYNGNSCAKDAECASGCTCSIDSGKQIGTCTGTCLGP